MLKGEKEMRDAGPDTEIPWWSKVDKFDARLARVRSEFSSAHQADARRHWEGAIRDLSLYEFYSKYEVNGRSGIRNDKAGESEDVWFFHWLACCFIDDVVQLHLHHSLDSVICLVIVWIHGKVFFAVGT